MNIESITRFLFELITAFDIRPFLVQPTSPMVVYSQLYNRSGIEKITFSERRRKRNDITNLLQTRSSVKGNVS